MTLAVLASFSGHKDASRNGAPQVPGLSGSALHALGARYWRVVVIGWIGSRFPILSREATVLIPGSLQEDRR